MVDSGLAPSQWETSLQSNAVFYWLGANLEPATLLKPLSHQGGVLTMLTATARRAINLRTPRCAQWDLLERRRIAMASPWHLHWTPWGLLGRHATARTLCMHKVRAVARRSHGDLNERRVNAVGSQRQRSNSAVRYPRAPRGRGAHAAGTHMIAARTPPYTTIRECNEEIKRLTTVRNSISKTLFSAILFS